MPTEARLTHESFGGNLAPRVKTLIGPMSVSSSPGVIFELGNTSIKSVRCRLDSFNRDWPLVQNRLRLPPILLPLSERRRTRFYQSVGEFRRDFNARPQVSVDTGLWLRWSLPAEADKATPVTRQVIKVKLQWIRWGDATTFREHLLVARYHGVDSFCEQISVHGAGS
jgi:hypothetical protein